MVFNSVINSNPAFHICLIGFQVFLNSLDIFARLAFIALRGIPIRDFHTDENPDDHDQEVERNGGPVLRFDLFCDAAKKHLYPQRNSRRSDKHFRLATIVKMFDLNGALIVLLQRLSEPFSDGEALLSIIVTALSKLNAFEASLK
ncbi:MAG: hypothetical protein HKP25_11525 [Marinicaulis sp.]|nr:hypothetical protein [Marinicaulis sp.]